MTFLQASLFGLLGGITQFLPVSASGHFVLLPWFFRWPDAALPLKVFVVSGLLLALVICFGKEWWYLVRGGVMSIIERKIGYDRDRALFWLMLVALVPSFVGGVLFHESTHADFDAPLVISIFLASVGFLLYWVDGRYANVRQLEEIRLRDALWIGCGLALGIIPGVSRLAMAVIVGRLLGLGRESAVRFSLLLLVPVLFGLSLWLWWELTLQPGIVIPMPQLLTGFGVAAVTGIITINVLLGVVRGSTLAAFAWYRITLATLIVLWSLIFRV